MADEAEGDAVVRKKRKLKRHSSKGDLPVSVCEQICIRGKWQKEWRVLPTISWGDDRCAVISPYQPWVHQLLGGIGCDEQYSGAIWNFIHECRIAVGELQASDSQEDPQASGKGKAAILNDSDDESDEEPETKPKTKSKPRGVGPRRGDLMNLSIHGSDITVASIGSKRVVILATNKNLQQVIDYIHARRGETRSGGDPEGQALIVGATDSSEYLTEQDEGRIAWVSTTGTWRIVYTDSSGRTRRTTRGMQVPVQTPDGVSHTHTEFEDIRRRLLRQARQLWDDCDMSPAPRYGATSSV